MAMVPECKVTGIYNVEIIHRQREREREMCRYSVYLQFVLIGTLIE